ncbi:MAG: hypothetical protein ACYDEA_00425 [Candidatus Dormibacteria bacterium]
MDKAGKGALLRREGRYSPLITEWVVTGTDAQPLAWPRSGVALR